MTDGPTLSRRHAAGSPGARGLVFTVLREFVLPNGGAAWTSALIDAVSRLGVEEKNVRQALMRTAADGWLVAERVGRRTRWRLTTAAERMLTEGAERIYGFTGTAERWDGRWLLVLARVPETVRPARHRLRTRMRWAGFGSPEPGVWISPHTDRLAEARQLLAEADAEATANANAGVETGVKVRVDARAEAQARAEAGDTVETRAETGGRARVFVARQPPGYDDATLARQAWDLDALARDYEAFLSDFAEAPEPPDPMAALTALVHAWRRFPFIDPLLPASLLPDPWPGTQAATLFRHRHAAWSAAAQTAWAALNP